MLKLKKSFTVITVTYRESVDRVEQTLNSIITQKYPPEKLEIIIKNGDPLDQSLRQLINKLSKRKNLYLIESYDSGVYDAMNQAIEFSTKNWIIFMNVGDIFFDSNVVARVAESMTYEPSQKPLIFYGNCIYRGSILLPPKRVTPFFMYANSICHQAIVASSSIFHQHKILFNTNYTIIADRAWILECLLKGFNFLRINTTICVYETSNVSVSSNIPLSKRELKVYRHHFYSKYLRKLFMSLSILGRIHAKILKILTLAKKELFKL